MAAMLGLTPMTCPLCAQPYDSGVLNRTPKLLICGHICCLECIQFVAGANGAGVACPQTVSQGNDQGRGRQPEWSLDTICGQNTVRPDGGFEKLMTGLQDQTPDSSDAHDRPLVPVMPPPGPGRNTVTYDAHTIGACQITRMAIRRLELGYGLGASAQILVGHTSGDIDAQFRRLPHAWPWNVTMQIDRHGYPHDESDSDSLPSLVSSNHADSDTEPATQ